MFKLFKINSLNTTALQSVHIITLRRFNATFWIKKMSFKVAIFLTCLVFGEPLFVYISNLFLFFTCYFQQNLFVFPAYINAKKIQCKVGGGSSSGSDDVDLKLHCCTGDQCDLLNPTNSADNIGGHATLSFSVFLAFFNKFIAWMIASVF